MEKVDLSVLITARNEMFLKRTIDDVLANSRGKTEVIVVFDGGWPLEPIPDDPRITSIYHHESIGQRAAINEAAKVSQATFIMKLDAHCTVDEGFDVKLMADCEYNWTVIPRLYNLHAFDWVCPKCKNTTYQGPTPQKCFKEGCDGIPERNIIWKPRLSRKSDHYRFDSDLKFQYWGDFAKRPEGKLDISDTLSNLGACFFMHRQWYWDIGGSEEEWGSWGQQGTEISCKTWLSGGRQVVNKKTWYSHLFRTQGGDFGFPYPLSGKQVEKARRKSKQYFLQNTWKGQKYPLSWLIEKFWPVPGWTEEDLNKLKEVPLKNNVKEEMSNVNSTDNLKKGIIYYTDNQLNLKIAHLCKKNIKSMGLPITSASLKPMNDMGKNVVIHMKRGYLAMFKQILAALEASDADIVYFCEHDWLYDKSHFDFTPPKKDVYYYNKNWWRVRVADGLAVKYDTQLLPGICAYRELLLNHYRKRVERLEKYSRSGDLLSDCCNSDFDPLGFEKEEVIWQERCLKCGNLCEPTWQENSNSLKGFNDLVYAMGFEPGTHNRPERIDDNTCEFFTSEIPILDLRHTSNLTSSKWSPDAFRSQRNCKDWQETRDIPGWGPAETFIK